MFFVSLLERDLCKRLWASPHMFHSSSASVRSSCRSTNRWCYISYKALTGNLFSGVWATCLVKEKFRVYHFSSLTWSPFFQNQVCQDGRLCKHLIMSSPLLETSKRFTSAGCFGLYLYTFPFQQPLFTHSLSKCLSAALLSLRPSLSFLHHS